MRIFINERTKDLKQGAIRAMFDKAANISDVVSLGIGEPDMTTPEIVCEACKKALDEGFTHYTPNAGLPMFRKAIATKSSIKNLGYDPMKEIIVTNGGMGALSLLFSVIINPGDEILIQDPQWLNYKAQVQYYGGIPVAVPTTAENAFQMQPETIEKLVTNKTKAIMINSPNNPTGCVADDRILNGIADIAKKYDLLVISDEVYNTLFYDGTVVKSISEFSGMKERTIVVNSFSKSYAMTGWRIGFTAGPADIIDRMTKCQENFNACANAMGQIAATRALDYPALCDQLRETFAKRRTIILEGLNKIPGIKCGKPNGAFYVFPDISSFGLSSEEFCTRLLEEGKVVCVPGSAFGSCGEGHMRISYANSDENLKKAVERIAAFCDKLGK